MRRCSRAVDNSPAARVLFPVSRESMLAGSWHALKTYTNYWTMSMTIGNKKADGYFFSLSKVIQKLISHNTVIAPPINKKKDGIQSEKTKNVVSGS